MTAPSPEFTEYILELLEPINPVEAKRFFGGVGLSNGFVQFAMLMGDSLYFVVDNETRTQYEQAGMQPFSYLTKKGRVQVRRYFEVPEDVLADPEQLQCWAQDAILAASATQKPKRSKQKKYSGLV
jgi:DNA transformation protein and related proteins